MLLFWYSDFMKKVNKKKLIQILQNKGSKTYKELAKSTGYHEKSLIRIQHQLSKGTYLDKHGNSFKTPHNKIDDAICQKLIQDFQNGNFKTKKEFYNYLRKRKINYSYSFICKIIKKKRKPVKKKNKFISIKRKMIMDNIIQYNNIRYRIVSVKPIKHHEIVQLIVDNKTLKPLYIKYKNKKYEINFQKNVHSVKGNTKYN